MNKEITPERSSSGSFDRPYPKGDIADYIKEMQDDSVRWFPNGGLEISTLVLGLVGEAGEVADQLKKYLRGSKSWEEAREKMAIEIIDVFHYWCLLVGLLDIDVEQIYRMKRAFNERRYTR